MKNGFYIKDYTKYEYLKGWEKISLGEKLEDWAKKYKNKIAISTAEKEITYKELNLKAEEMSYGFLELGINKGEKVLVQLPNRISFIITIFALMKIGAIPIMALPAHRESELSGIIENAKPKAYIIADKYQGYNYINMAENLKNKYDCLKEIIVDGNSENNINLLSIKGDKKEKSTIDGYNTALLLLSGGTTGTPKLIPRTHTDYLYNARMAAEKCNINENSVYLVALPAAHNFTLSSPGILGTLDKGGKVVLCKNTSPDEILNLITEKKGTITSLVPAMITMCLELLELDDSYDISSLEVLLVGGAVLEDSLADKIVSELSCKLAQVFGTAEGLICITSLNDTNDIVVRCQGKPISSADKVKIVDENDNEVVNGKYGELLTKGPYTIDGYYMNESANKESFTKDGYYRTGDRAMWTKEGNIKIEGRIKEQINRAGEKIMPSEIESLLCKHYNIKEAAVLGVTDEILGNKICAFVLLEDDEEISLEDIHKFFNNLGIASYKFPDDIRILEMWPVTSVGKVDKKALKKLL